MDTMNIALPETLKEYVQMRVNEGGFGSVNEYVGELIRADQKQKVLAALEAEVLKGLRSGSAEPMTEKDWAEIRGEVRRQGEARAIGWHFLTSGGSAWLCGFQSGQMSAATWWNWPITSLVIASTQLSDFWMLPSGLSIFCLSTARLGNFAIFRILKQRGCAVGASTGSETI